MTELKVVHVVDYILDEMNKKKVEDTSPLKLQRMLFIAKTQYYVETGKELFPEDFHRWDPGPTHLRTMYKYKPYVNKNINEDYSTDHSILKLHLEQKDVIDKVIKKYAHLDCVSSTMTKLTLGSDIKKKKNTNDVIGFDDIKKYYKCEVMDIV